jgi:hypothetical protein
MGFSILPRDETSEHAVDLKVITKVRNVSLEKVQNQNHADHIFLHRKCDS